MKAANGLTDSMLAEVPPDDGHRKNLLNKDLKRIGLSVVRDSKGVTWMVQDFVN
ncbi:CAP domain-containing protein [Actinoplanes sp. Pm04-4]|uniref:CAP domain-containing protein n=1 Tax=Paractinoplanes pyxinae TaxID=2997416 RepID=A0ABT4B7D8_9ACTN|nr:CAP domain-containing protein [Actinoplanes pyxinae]